MRIAVPKEIKNGETRVAVTPDIVKKYKYMGIEVSVQSGAGEASSFSDKDYREAGADIEPDCRKTCSKQRDELAAMAKTGNAFALVIGTKYLGNFVIRDISEKDREILGNLITRMDLSVSLKEYH